MYTICIMTASRTGARIFESVGPGPDLTLVDRIAHPEGRLSDKNIDTDRQGVVRSSADTSRQHIYDASQDAADHMADVFAKRLATHLDLKRARHEFEKLVLVAEPRFLGKVRAALSKETAAHVHMTIAKDMHLLSERELKEKLGDLGGLWTDVHRLDRTIPSNISGGRSR